MKYTLTYRNKQGVEARLDIITFGSTSTTETIEGTDTRRNQFAGDETDERYKTPSGLIMAMPIYYRNKLYTEEEREKLWIYKIDKEIIYKGKIKYDISTKEGLKKLWKTEDYMRKIDERDGYPKHPWKKEIYAKKGGKIAPDEKIDYIRDKS